MFREMRRKKQVLSFKDSVEILNRGTSGVLAVSGDGGYPYAVPMSYVYHDQKIFFHCAQAGHKIDAIAKNDRVSFCVIDQDQVVSEKFTTYFRSVIAFGKARILADDTQKRAAIEILTARYCPDHEEEGLQEIEKSFKRLCLVELAIEHLSGKEALELVNARQDHGK